MPGGTGDDPTYDSIGDYSESVQLDFDPSVVSYEHLVELFYAAHDATLPASQAGSTSRPIFFGDAEQERIARAVTEQVELTVDGTIRTEIAPLTKVLHGRGLSPEIRAANERHFFREFPAMYPDLWDLVDSASRHRVNAYLYGCGTGTASVRTG